MSQTGFSPILIYASGTASNTPSAANMTSNSSGAELALNYADGRLFYKDSGGVVQVLATKGTAAIGGSNTQIQYNSSGTLAGSANLTFDGTTLTAAALSGPHNGTVGATTPNTGSFTTLSASSTTTLSGGTANGVAYLNGSKVLTTGSALTFDGTNLGVGTSSPSEKLTVQKGNGGIRLDGAGTASSSVWVDYYVPNNGGVSTSSNFAGRIYGVSSGVTDYSDNSIRIAVPVGASSTPVDTLVVKGGNVGIGTSSPGYKLDVARGSSGIVAKFTGTASAYVYAGSQDVYFTSDTSANNAFGANSTSNYLNFYTNGTEQMRLTSTGLGIGTSSPGSKLTVLSTGSTIEAKQSSAGAATYYVMDTTVETNGKRWRFGYTGASGTTPGMFSFLNVTDNVIGPVIDSSGNLGLGVTPSAWNASHPAFQFKYNTAISSYSSNDGLELTSNGYADTATTWKYIESYSAAQYVVGGGQHAWKIAALGTAGTAITWTQAMTLDASGNLGIGLSSLGYGTNVRLTLYRPSMPELVFADDLTPSASAAPRIAGGSAYMTFSTNGSERARIDSSGNLLVATSTVGGSGGLTAYPAYGGAGAYVGLIWNKSATNGTACEFRHNGTAVGSISSTATVTTYAISSDYRLKHDIAPMTGALAKVAALKPVTYKWNADDSDGEGFIAHELAEVVPHAVVGEKDAVDEEGNPVYQGIDTSFLVATLTAAIQEQQALITQLTERITALEGK